MIVEQPPESELTDFLNRLQRNMINAIESVNDISTYETFPERPRSGKIYYIKPTGYWIWENETWKNLETS